jgi:hypothetical protein
MLAVLICGSFVLVALSVAGATRPRQAAVDFQPL